MKESMIGRGALYTGRSGIGRSRGLYTRENAGISSESEVRILTVESLRIPGAGSSAQGKSGAKQRPKGVCDAQLVDNPVPPYIDKEPKQGRRRIVEPRGWKGVAKSRGFSKSEVHLGYSLSDEGERK